MEICRTFDEQFQGVYLARFVDCSIYVTPSEYETELDKIQDQLQDPLFVRNFIKSPRSGWKIGNFKNSSLRLLTRAVLKEAGDLFDKLDELLEESQDGNCFDLLFDNFKEISIKEKYNLPGRRKMYTYDHDSLLRLYGIRLNNNCIIITGVGLKFVDAMQDCKALQLELNKMNYLIDWLNENKITDCSDF